MTGLAELTEAHPEWRRISNLPEYCDVMQVAVFTQRNPQTIRRHIRSGLLRATQYGPKHPYRVTAGDLERYLLGKRPAPRR